MKTQAEEQQRHIAQLETQRTELLKAVDQANESAKRMESEAQAIEEQSRRM